MNWNKLYPILDKYKKFEDIELFNKKINDIMKELMENYNITNEEAFLIVKEIAYHEYKIIK